MRSKPIHALVFGYLAASVILFTSATAVAEEDSDKLHQLQLHYDAKIKALEKRVTELEKSAQNVPQPIIEVVDGDDTSHQSEPVLKWALAGLGTLGGSSATADELELLQGGSHDPRKNGFTVQALAVAVRADFGKYLDATASIVAHIEPDGENIVELGQAYLRSTDRPLGLTIMAGQFFQDFGEENKRHAADWDFVDVPFLLSRFFGSDKLRTQGVQFAWDVPLSWSSTIYLGANNPQGETAASFLFEEGETVGGHLLQARDVEGLDDLLYLLKWSHNVPAGTRNHIGLGASALFGPNASGRSTDTQIYGLNLEWSHYRSGHDHQPLFDWRTELMYRRYEAGDRSDPDHETLADYGAFTQVLWRIRDDWAAGLRVEFADGNKDSDDDPFRGSRKRFAVNLTYTVLRNVWWRLQYNRDQADYLSDGSANSLWMQLGYKAGGHDEH